MYGKNIIGTDEAFEGYDLDYEKAGARCNTKEEFITAINHFSSYQYPLFNIYSRKMFVNNYSEKERKKRFAAIFQ
jgi:hypothetical protein